MDLFFNQGRCRVCGQMFCCRKHQLEHERVQHDDYADWLDMLPALCRRCHRTVTNIHDLKGKCIQFNMMHTLQKNELICSPVGTPKRSIRKRVISVKAEDIEDEYVELGSDDNTEANIVESRRKITAFRRLKKRMSPIVLIDLNEIKNRDDIMNTVFSPQFNISQNILSGDAKSSTPLYDEKENYPVIAIFDQNDMSMYKTPQAVQGASLVVVSALKKSTPREGIMKGSSSKTKKSNGRKVTFEMAQTPEIESREMSIYSTPEVEVPIPDRRRSTDLRGMTISFEKVENDENSRVEISVYGTMKSDNELVVDPSDTDNDKDRDCVAVTELMRNVKSTVTGIPRMIFNACSWSARVIRKRKNDDTSPICEDGEKQNRRMLKRRPISSHKSHSWINLSTTSLRRRPLATYRTMDHDTSI